MILRCDGHFSRSQIFDWLITAAMPKFQFEGPPAKGKTEHLMTKANSEDRFATHQIADRLVGIRQRLRITRAVRQKNAIRIERQEFPSAADNHLTILRLASCSGFRLALR